MKKFINEYFKIIEVTIIGLVFIISSFYLMMNYYHSLEISEEVYISNNDRNYLAYRETISQIEKNLRSYNTKTGLYKQIHNGLTKCVNLMKKDGTLYSIKPNTFMNGYDIYLLGSNFETNLYNSCYAFQLNESNLDISEFIDLNAKTINSNVAFAINELKNNSSYHFTTNITKTTIRNNLHADYTAIANSYNDFANLILEVSNYINQEVEGGIND